MTPQNGDPFLDEEAEIQGRTLEGGLGIDDVMRRAVILRRWQGKALALGR